MEAIQQQPWDEFLATTPPGQKREITDAVSMHSTQKTLLRLSTLRMDCWEIFGVHGGRGG